METARSLIAVSEEGPPYGTPPSRGRHLRLGERGEAAAERHLVSLGYRILARRFRCRAGEIDLIAEDGPTLVFIEVKTRSSLAFGSPGEAVGALKRSRIAAAASLYLARSNHDDRACRFDVVEVLEISVDAPVRVRLVRDAFEAG